MCARVCVCVHAPIYDRDTSEGGKRNVIQPRRDAERARGRGRARQRAHPGELFFLVTHPVFVPALPPCVWGGHEMLPRPRRETNSNRESADKQKRLGWCLNTSRPVDTTTHRKCWTCSAHDSYIIHTIVSMLVQLSARCTGEEWVNGRILRVLLRVIKGAFHQFHPHFCSTFTQVLQHFGDKYCTLYSLHYLIALVTSYFVECKMRQSQRSAISTHLSINDKYRIQRCAHSAK